MLSFRGRVNRRKYWCGMVVLVVVTFLVGYVTGTESGAGLWPLLLFWLPIGSYLSILLMVKRLHDIGESGWLCLVSVIPLIGVFFVLWLGVASRKPDEEGQPELQEPEVASLSHDYEQGTTCAGPDQETDLQRPDITDKNDVETYGVTARTTERPDPPLHHPRDDMEREQEQQLQEFLHRQEERQRDWERRLEQLRAENAAHESYGNVEAGVSATELPSADDGVLGYSGQAQPDGPIPITASRSKSRRGLLAPLIVSFLTLAIVVGIGVVVAYVVLSSPSETPAPVVVEPTRDLEATITAAVAAVIVPTPTTSLPVDQPEGGVPSHQQYRGTSNEAPTVSAAIGDITIVNEVGSRQVSLSGVFDGPEGDVLTITTASSDETIAMVSVATDGSNLTLNGVAEGTATITVTAQDSDGNTVSDAFAVTVTAAQQEQQHEEEEKDYSALIAQIYEWRNDPNGVNNPSHIKRWDRTLLAFGETVSPSSLTPMTAAEAAEMAKKYQPARWNPVVEALREIES